MLRLGQLLNVIGQGERVKVGLRSMTGFKFIGTNETLLSTPEVRSMYDYPVYNVYTACDVRGAAVIVILDDIGDE